MKQKLLLVVIFASALQSLSAQFPGGVESPQVWAHDTLSMQMRSALGFTYIGVSKVVDEKEHALWVLGNEHNTALIQTTARSADLTRGTFLNYAPEGFPELRLYSYTTSSRLDGMQHLHVGQAKTQKLPVKDIGKGIVEYAVYNRRLSEQERQRVESYMALKYGVSLLGRYLDSRGRVIWDAYANKKYGHRIAGLISDSQSGLYLNRARSSEEGYFLTIGTSEKLADKQSLLWGDDNGKLAFVPSKAYGRWLDRKWLFSASQTGDLLVDVVADVNQLRQIQPLADGESYYLAIDSTRTGNFSVKTVQYHKAVTSAASIVFKNIRPSDKHIFTLRAAGDMFTTINVHQPDENSDYTGRLDVRVTGGLPPFRMQLRREDTSVYDRSHNDTLQTMDNLEEGVYLLTTTDKVGNVSEHEFQISATGITELPVAHASKSSERLFCRVSVVPNPTSDGHVRVQVELAVDAPLDMTLYTLDGAKVSSVSMKPDTYFAPRIHLPTPGVYLLTLKSGTNEKSIKLMRK